MPTMPILISPTKNSTDLYSLAPKGIGTTLCECVDSLLRRLALAYRVTYPALMKHIYKTSALALFFQAATEDFRRSLLFKNRLIPSIAESTGCSDQVISDRPIGSFIVGFAS
jgi:hypothetical protein